MKKNIVLLLIIVFYYTHLSHAQKQTTFYLMPNAGIEWPFSKFENKSLKPAIVKNVTSNTTDKYGMALLIDVKKKYSIEIGYGHGNIGRGVILYKNRRSSFKSSRVNRLYIAFSKPIKTVEIFKRRHENLDKLLKLDKSFNYWAVFDIRFLGGISYGHIPPFTSQSSFSLNGRQIQSRISNITRNGFGIQGGMNFQFYKNQNKTILIGIIYQKGLQKRIVADWIINVDGLEEPTFSTFSEDSMLAIYAAYPIKLFSIKEKGTIKK